MIQATKLRPIISVPCWLLPLSHELSHSQYHTSIDVDQKSKLELNQWQVNGLGVDFAGMERAALSTALTQVAALVLMINIGTVFKKYFPGLFFGYAECNHYNCCCLSCFTLKRHTNSTEVSCVKLKREDERDCEKDFYRWELLQGSLLAGGVAAGPLVATPVRLDIKHERLRT